MKAWNAHNNGKVSLEYLQNGLSIYVEYHWRWWEDKTDILLSTRVFSRSTLLLQRRGIAALYAKLDKVLHVQVDIIFWWWQVDLPMSPLQLIRFKYKYYIASFAGIFLYYFSTLALLHKVKRNMPNCVGENTFRTSVCMLHIRFKSLKVINGGGMSCHLQNF